MALSRSLRMNPIVELFGNAKSRIELDYFPAKQVSAFADEFQRRYEVSYPNELRWFHSSAVRTIGEYTAIQPYEARSKSNFHALHEDFGPELKRLGCIPVVSDGAGGIFALCVFGGGENGAVYCTTNETCYEQREWIAASGLSQFLKILIEVNAQGEAWLEKDALLSIDPDLLAITDAPQFWE